MDMVVLIDSPGFRLIDRSRLLKSADVLVVVEAAELLKRAHQRDKLLLQQTLAAYEQAQTNGRRKGMEDAQALMSGHLAAAVAAKHLALEELSPMLVNIVSEAMALLLKDADRAKLFVCALDVVSGLLRKAQWAEMRVHPSQAENARRSVNESSSGLSALKPVTVVSDSDLGVDDCIFETDVGIADASLSVQLQAINSAMEAAIASLVKRSAMSADSHVTLPECSTD